MRRPRRIACVTALAVACIVARSRSDYAEHVTPPPVPASVQVPAGSKVFLELHAVGTQDYICLPSDAGVTWTFLGPRATLFNGKRKQVVTHFLSSNPFESGTPRVTWQDSGDTSTVWGKALASSSDPAFVAPDAIPWLLLQVVGAQDGPAGGHTLRATGFIQRLNTSGGIAPAIDCTLSIDIGRKALVPYTADYLFYKGGERNKTP